MAMDRRKIKSAVDSEKGYHKRLKKTAKAYLEVRSDYYDKRLDRINYTEAGKQGYIGIVSFFDSSYWDRGFWFVSLSHNGERVEYKIPWRAVEDFSGWKKDFIAKRQRQLERRKQWEEEVKLASVNNTDSAEYELYLKLKKKYEGV